MQNAKKQTDLQSDRPDRPTFEQHDLIETRTPKGSLAPIGLGPEINRADPKPYKNIYKTYANEPLVNPIDLIDRVCAQRNCQARIPSARCNYTLTYFLQERQQRILISSAGLAAPTASCPDPRSPTPRAPPDPSGQNHKKINRKHFLHKSLNEIGENFSPRDGILTRWSRKQFGSSRHDVQSQGARAQTGCCYSWLVRH